MKTLSDLQTYVDTSTFADDVKGIRKLAEAGNLEAAWFLYVTMYSYIIFC